MLSSFITDTENKFKLLENYAKQASDSTDLEILNEIVNNYLLHLNKPIEEKYLTNLL